MLYYTYHEYYISVDWIGIDWKGPGRNIYLISETDEKAVVVYYYRFLFVGHRAIISLSFFLKKQVIWSNLGLKIFFKVGLD